MERREIILTAEQVVQDVGERVVDGALSVSEFARDDTSKIMAVFGVVLVVLGMRAMSQNSLRRRNLENKDGGQIREENEVNN